MGRRKNRIRTSLSVNIFQGINYIFLTILALLCVYPMWYAFAASVSESSKMMMHMGILLKPLGFTLAAYKQVFSNPNILTGYANTLFILIVGVIVCIFMTSLGAYVLSRKNLMWRNVMMMIIMFTMFFSGGMIPSYLLIDRLNMLDTVWAILLPTALSAYNVVLVRTYMSSNIPKDLYECASLDGCSDFRYLVSIVIPLSKTIIAVMALLYGVGIWNNYFNAMMYIRDRNLYPFQLVLRDVLVLNMGMGNPSDIAEQQERLMFSYLLKYSTIVVGCLPVMIAYPFVQKYFVKGIMIGALKG